VARIDPVLARDVARGGARCLAGLVQDDGRFVYGYEETDPPQLLDRYNVLRHCGTVWSMFDVVRMTGPDAAVTAAACRAGLHILDHFVASLPEFPQWPAVVVDTRKVKLGGAGLAILALIELHRVTSDERALEVPRRLGEYVLDQQQDDGDFVHIRRFPSGEVSPFRSGYYTGEALLGLVRLADVTGDERFLEAACRSLLALHEREYGVAEGHHWLLYALELAHARRPLDQLLDYATKIADRIVGESGHRLGGGSCRAATKSEGLLARLRMPDADGSRGRSYEAALQEDFVVQLRSRTPDGAFRASPERRVVRIDYIQHNISSFAHYYEQYRTAV